jgi:pyrrolidone-carboxylate peptidase
VAIGSYAATLNQDQYAVAIGFSSGLSDQGSHAIAIGVQAGQASQGANSIAIGYNAGRNNQATNSIVINATGSSIENNIANSLVITPIRTDSTPTDVLYYNTTTKEVTYGNKPTIPTKTSDITNDSTFVTLAEMQNYVNNLINIDGGNASASFTTTIDGGNA